MGDETQTGLLLLLVVCGDDDGVGSELCFRLASSCTSRGLKIITSPHALECAMALAIPFG